MGYGEYGGNGSVHWQVAHENNQGQEKPLNCHPGQGQPPTTPDDVNIQKRARGKDGIALADVGKRKGHTGKFRVRLRFEDVKDAQAVANAVTPVFDSATQMWTLIFDVPVIQRDDPNDPPAYEVRVDW